MMFDPEFMLDKVMRYTGVRTWYLYDHSEVYALNRTDGTTEYYLVEKEYPHDINVMLRLIEAKLKVKPGSKRANELVWKITKQIKKYQENQSKTTK